MYIIRDLEGQIIKYLKRPEIIAVVGPRQCGKTTLLRHIFNSLKKAVFVDFEDRDILNLFNNDIKSFYNLRVKGADYLFIDEFQYALDGGRNLKYLYDTYGLKIVISGSSALDLTHQALKYLVGRIFTFHLSPFDFKEFLSYRDPVLHENVFLDIKKGVDQYLYGKRKKPPVISEQIVRELHRYYNEYAIFGGYPMVVLTKDKEEKIIVLKNIYNTYLLREIRDILQLSTENELQRLIKALSLQIGSMAVYNELSQTSSLDYKNLLRHLNILEKTFLIKMVLPFFKNKRTEIAKSPKIYFWDNGFRNVAAGNFQPLNERIDRGSLNENFVAGQMLKKGFDIRYWRTKSSAEIDFVIENEGRNTAVEVKSMLSSNKPGKAVFNFREKYNAYRTVILSENLSLYDKKREIIFLPIFFI